MGCSRRTCESVPASQGSVVGLSVESCRLCGVSLKDGSDSAREGAGAAHRVHARE